MALEIISLMFVKMIDTFLPIGHPEQPHKVAGGTFCYSYTRPGFTPCQIHPVNLLGELPQFVRLIFAERYAVGVTHFTSQPYTA